MNDMTVVTAATDTPFERALRLGVVTMFCIAAWLVLKPFLTAILLALVVATSTWTPFVWLKQRLKSGIRIPAFLMCAAISVLMLVPALIVLSSVSDALGWAVGVYEELRQTDAQEFGIWLHELPVAGSWLASLVHDLAVALPSAAGSSGYLAGDLRELAVDSGRSAVAGSLQACMAIVVLYFLYCNGSGLVDALHKLTQRIGGPYASSLLITAKQTVISATLAVVGTAAAQGLVAYVGFELAGLPQPTLMAAAVFALSIAPIGPPLVWGGAAIWLYGHDRTGACMFMVLYGALCVSTVDNVIKPLIISRGTHLPFAVTLIGALGGIAAFGLLGMVLGPTILALSVNLTSHWLEKVASLHAEATR